MCAALVGCSAASCSGLGFQGSTQYIETGKQRSGESVTSPHADLGRDFQVLIDQCLSELKTPPSGQEKEDTMGDQREECSAATDQDDDLLRIDGDHLETSGERTMEDTLDGDWVLVATCGATALGDPNQSSSINRYSLMSIEDETSEKLDQHDPFNLSCIVEWPHLGDLKVEKTKPCKGNAKSAEKTKKAKFPSKKKMKQKAVPQIELGFHYSNLTHRQMNFSWEEELEMEKELLMFEKSHEQPEETKSNNAKLSNGEKDTSEKAKAKMGITKTTDLVPKGKHQGKKLSKISQITPKCKKPTLPHEPKEDFWGLPDLTFLTMSAAFRVLHFEGNISRGIRLRRKGKWRIMKSHNACKTKHFNPNDRPNKPDGQKIYVSSRIYNKLGIQQYIPYYRPIKSANKGFPTLKELREARNANRQKENVIVDHRTPPRKVAERAVINVRNADNAFDGDLVSALVAMQERDLTPEDYELLLRLDDRVKPKTVERNILDSLKTSVVTEATLTNLNGEIELCAVCIEPYELGQVRKHLPCGHIFHSKCIDNWLNFSSQNCPLDGLPCDS